MSQEILEEIKPLKIEIDSYRPFYYAGASGDFNEIHIDNEFAKKVGLGGIILQGLCTMAYVFRAVAPESDPYSVKNFKVRFRQVVKPGNVITVKGKIISKEGKKSTIETFAENEKGEQVITNGQAILSDF